MKSKKLFIRRGSTVFWETKKQKRRSLKILWQCIFILSWIIRTSLLIIVVFSTFVFSNAFFNLCLVSIASGQIWIFSMLTAANKNNFYSSWIEAIKLGYVSSVMQPTPENVEEDAGWNIEGKNNCLRFWDRHVIDSFFFLLFFYHIFIYSIY